jgi:hypothetical protein
VSCHEPPLVACAPLVELDPTVALVCGEELAAAPAELVLDEPEVSVEVADVCVVPVVVATACVPALLSAAT